MNPGRQFIAQRVPDDIPGDLSGRVAVDIDATGAVQLVFPGKGVFDDRAWLIPPDDARRLAEMLSDGTGPDRVRVLEHSGSLWRGRCRNVILMVLELKDRRFAVSVWMESGPVSSSSCYVVDDPRHDVFNVVQGIREEDHQAIRKLGRIAWETFRPDDE